MRGVNKIDFLIPRSLLRGSSFVGVSVWALERKVKNPLCMVSNSQGQRPGFHSFFAASGKDSGNYQGNHAIDFKPIFYYIEITKEMKVIKIEKKTAIIIAKLLINIYYSID